MRRAHYVRDSKGAAMFLFCEAKAKTASRGRKKFPSGNLFVTESLRLRQFFMNKYEKHPECVIDLHGYTTREAEDALGALLKNSAYEHIRVIVGKGNRSTDGPVLRDFVKRYLSLRNIRFNQSKQKDGGEGALEVFLA